MGNITIIGSQLGDEGKGKIVDWLAERADVVVRFQGGHNAGHTLVVEGKTYKLHLLPSGVVRKGKLSIIGNGVVVDPWALVQEIKGLKEQGIEITPKDLVVSDAAAMILPLHGSLDRAMETARGAKKIGTTGRGIGPAYEDKVGRRSLRICDLAHPETLPAKVSNILEHHNALLKGLGEKPFDANDVIQSLRDIAPNILPFIAPSWKKMDDAVSSGKKILFEGAQGTLLDVDHGTYPFVTSSNTAAAQAATGCGVGPQHIGYILGITKAYTTRVGTGPFPTELKDDIGDLLTERGHEYGTTTGRRRRCGWFDAALVRQSVKINGLDGIALTKIDVMDTLPEVKICTGYTCDGKPYDHLPAALDLQEKLEPVYETLPGWQTSLEGCRDFNALPKNAMRYIRRIEELIGVPAAVVSTSPRREDTILVKDPFAA